MDSPRACPTCAAPAEARQRWCLECGAELPQGRRGALRPAAGGYTLLHGSLAPPPPATTVAAAPTAPATIPPATGGATGAQTPNATYPSSPSPTLPLGTSGTSVHPFAPAHPHVTTPHASSKAATGAGSVTSTPPSHAGSSSSTTTTTPAPQLALTNVALGAAAVVYAPYTSGSVDLGDASRVVDGTTKTGWRTPAVAAGAAPQIGVYVDLASAQKLRKLVIDTSTPGISVEIYGATNGPPATITDPAWDHLATRNAIDGSTTIGLPSRPYRYLLVWIVGLPPGTTSAAISELSLLSLQPE
jgi:hypothetical protein